MTAPNRLCDRITPGRLVAGVALVVVIGTSFLVTDASGVLYAFVVVMAVGLIVIGVATWQPVNGESADPRSDPRR